MSTRLNTGRGGARLAFIGLAQICCLGLLGAELLPPGFRPAPPGVHALVGGRIVIKPGQVLDRGTIIIRDGVITEVGQEPNVPADARVWDLQNLTIYAGFIDPWLVESGSESPTPATLDQPEAGQLSLTSPGVRFYGTPGAAVDSGETGPGYPVSRITPERRIATSYSPKEKQLAPLRELGFAAGVVVPAKGILRGTSALVLLEEASPNRVILRPDAFQHIALDVQASDDRAFPGSLMGVIASVRQTFFDARHYALEQAAYREALQGRKRPEYNAALEALLPASSQKMRVAFEPGSALMVDRAARIADELGVDAFLLSSGQEWRRPDLARATKAIFVVPLDFPELPKLPTEDDWEQVRLDQLRAWDWAPENPATLRREGLEIAFTTHGLSDKKKFRENLRLAIARGLSEEDAIAALTTVPARLCGVEKQLGTIERGKMANLTVVQGRSYFEPEAKVRAVWIEGRVYRPPADEPKAQPISEKAPAQPAPTRTGEAPEQQPKPPELAEVPKSAQPDESATPRNPPDERSGKPDAKKQQQILQIMKQRVARSPQEGRGALAEPAVLLLTNATLWTCGPQGVLTNADLLIRNGKIEAIGRGLRSRADLGTVILDATGRHVTPGLIDAHSHAAILGGVNESSIPSSAMVRIGDVVNSETENIYQQLAGGLTMANLLHGSANPIGGQNVVIKLRWGASPDGLVFKEAPAGIKFALGENPKQANWGEKFVTRFPQTRMGVRTFIANRFTAARQYIADWEKCRQAGTEGFLPPRRDLELEAIAEIIEGRRWIYCHAYRQDEMIMLMRLMEDFGVRIGSFEHVLEGYKVADEIARHGASASTFSDWWAYKFEVYDAIPYNGSLLRDRGVQVVFNSDSSEMARRLNTEAAKAVKFGATPEPEALKFVTLNPAKQLRIDAYVGSLEPGKHADFALWSRPPLDSTTACLQTWIEGKKYFDRDLAPLQAEALEKERAGLLAKAKRLAKAGAVATDKDPAGLSFFRVCLEHEHAGEDRGCHSGH